MVLSKKYKNNKIKNKTKKKLKGGAFYNLGQLINFFSDFIVSKNKKEIIISNIPITFSDYLPDKSRYDDYIIEYLYNCKRNSFILNNSIENNPLLKIRNPIKELKYDNQMKSLGDGAEAYVVIGEIDNTKYAFRISDLQLMNNKKMKRFINIINCKIIFELNKDNPYIVNWYGSIRINEDTISIYELLKPINELTLELNEKRQAILDLMNGIKMIIDNGTIHCDIHHNNYMFTDNKKLKIIDVETMLLYDKDNITHDDIKFINTDIINSITEAIYIYLDIKYTNEDINRVKTVYEDSISLFDYLLKNNFDKYIKNFSDPIVIFLLNKYRELEELILNFRSLKNTYETLINFDEIISNLQTLIGI